MKRVLAAALVFAMLASCGAVGGELEGGMLDAFELVRAFGSAAINREEDADRWAVSTGYFNYGEITLFHNKTLRNQGMTTVMLKLNTKSDRVAQRIESIENGPISDLRVEGIRLTIGSEDSRLHTDGYSCSPETGDEKIESIVLFKINDALGVGSVSRTYDVSEVEANCSRNANWSISCRLEPSELDGGVGTPTGLVVSVEYRYDGNVEEPLKACFIAHASVDYSYRVDRVGGGHNSFTAGGFDVRSPITILP